MRKTALGLCLILCLLLTGCTAWLDGSYSSVQPHTERNQPTDDQTLTVSNYQELRSALSSLVRTGSETVLINVAQMDQDQVSMIMDRAIWNIMETDPVGAYAVDAITYEQGTNSGQPALAVTVTYNHNRSELKNLLQANGMDEARALIAEALAQCEAKLVMQVSRYSSVDLNQFVQDYMDENPDLIMELPQLTVNIFPESGTSRVVELVFNYQSSRESLRSMQARVRPLFTSAELYVSGNGTEHDKYTLLYAFLMERNEYSFDTSLTPSYSLLVHGVGDSKAFATVYAAMCRRAGLECQVVTGTCDGSPLFWNILCQDGVYYHVDLLRSNQAGELVLLSDADMTGYVWDYSAYPQCIAPEPEPTEPSTEPKPPSEPEEG